MGLEVGGDAFDEVVDGDLVVLDHADDLQLRDAWKSDLQKISSSFSGYPLPVIRLSENLILSVLRN